MLALLLELRAANPGTNVPLSLLEPLQNEVFASRHQDQNSVACIEEKCYVLTFAEYCRWVVPGPSGQLLPADSPGLFRGCLRFPRGSPSQGLPSQNVLPHSRLLRSDVCRREKKLFLL